MMGEEGWLLNRVGHEQPAPSSAALSESTAQVSAEKGGRRRGGMASQLTPYGGAVVN